MRIVPLFLVLAITSMLLTFTAASAQQIVLSPADNQAKQDIVDALSKAVDHRWAQYDMINVSRSYDNSSFTVYNQSGFVPEPPIIVVPPIENETEGGPDVNVSEPVENETETPPPSPVENETVTVALVGDLDGNEVIDAVAKSKSDYNIALGDLGYDKSLSWFNNAWGSLENSKCVIGNHDSPEDGSESIYREAKAYCGDLWFLNIGNSTLFIGFNTQGNLQSQLESAKALINGADTEGIKNVVLVSHNPCATPPGSHHGVESNVKTFCDGVKSSLPQGVNLYGVAGHNHFMSHTSDDKWFISGSGGRSHYEGKTGSGWD